MFTRYDRDDVTFEIDWSAYEGGGGGGSSARPYQGVAQGRLDELYTSRQISDADYRAELKARGQSDFAIQDRISQLSNPGAKQRSTNDIVAGAAAGNYSQADAIQQLQATGMSAAEAQAAYDNVIRTHTLVAGGYDADMRRWIANAQGEASASAASAAAYADPTFGGSGQPDQPGATTSYATVQPDASGSQTATRQTNTAGASTSVAVKPKYQEKYPKTNEKTLWEWVTQGRISLDEYKSTLKGRGYSDAEVNFAVEDNTPAAERGDLNQFLNDPRRFERFTPSNTQRQREATMGGYDPELQMGRLGGTIPGVSPEVQFSFNPAMHRLEAGDKSPFDENDAGYALGDLQRYEELRALGQAPRSYNIADTPDRRTGVVDPNRSVFSTRDMKAQNALQRQKAAYYAPYLAEDKVQDREQADLLKQLQTLLGQGQPLMQNEGGTNYAGSSAYARHKPQLYANGGGFETPEEIAMVGTNTGKVYAIAGEGPDGPGGQAVPERIDVTPQPQMMANGGSALAGGRYGPVSQYARHRPDPRVLAGIESMYRVAKRPVSMTPMWSR